MTMSNHLRYLPGLTPSTMFRGRLSRRTPLGTCGAASGLRRGELGVVVSQVPEAGPGAPRHFRVVKPAPPGPLSNRYGEFLAENMEGYGNPVYFGGVGEGGDAIDLLLARLQTLGQLRRAHILANHLIEHGALEREAHGQGDEVFPLPFGGGSGSDAALVDAMFQC